MQPQDLCTVAAYSRPAEAHLAKNLLNENGIRAFVIDEHSAALDGWSALVETKVQVAAADAERAKILLTRGESQ